MRNVTEGADGTGNVVSLASRRKWRPKREEKPPVFLEDDEVRIVVREARRLVADARTLTARYRCMKDMTMLLFILQTGAKPRETSNATPEDIDVAGMAVFLPASAAGKPSGGKRRVPVGRILCEDLSAYISESAVSGKDKLFGTHKNSVTRSMCRLMTFCGIPREKSGPRVLRNTFAVRAIRCGVPLNEVSMAMGWNGNLQRALRYVEVAFPDQRSAWSAMRW